MDDPHGGFSYRTSPVRSEEDEEQMQRLEDENEAARATIQALQEQLAGMGYETQPMTSID
jgi:hypothetical protein